MYSHAYLEEFILDCRVRNLTPRTIKGYRNNVSLFLRHTVLKFGVVDPLQIQKIHIKSYVIYLQDRQMKPSYVATVFKSIKAFFVYLQVEGYISSSPLYNMQTPKGSKILIRTFTDDEVIAMLDVYSGKSFIDIRNKAILYMLFDTGIRNLECCTIKNDDIKDNGTILIFGKGRKERFVVPSLQTQKQLRKYERIRDSRFYAHPKSPYYFLSFRNNPLTNSMLERIVKDAGKQANVRKDIRSTPHTCRHYFAQRCLQNRMDVYSLSRLLGHERIDITKRYLQSISDENIFELVKGNTPLSNLTKGGRR